MAIIQRKFYNIRRIKSESTDNININNLLIFLSYTKSLFLTLII